MFEVILPQDREHGESIYRLYIYIYIYILHLFYYGESIYRLYIYIYIYIYIYMFLLH